MFNFVRYTGRVELNPLNPAQIDLRDIAFHVSRIRRFNNVSNITVGIHLLCAERLSEHRGHCVQRRLLHVLHDAHETYIMDMPRPIKRELPEYSALEDNCERTVLEHFDALHPDGYAEIDTYLLGCEIGHQFPGIPNTLTTPPVHDPLVHSWFDEFLAYTPEAIEAKYAVTVRDLMRRNTGDLHENQ